MDLFYYFIFPAIGVIFIAYLGLFLSSIWMKFDNRMAASSLKGLETAEINHTNERDKVITDYHRQSMYHNKIQFYFSLTIFMVGFCWILAIPLAFSLENMNSLWKFFPGVLLNILALASFRQTQQVNQKATDLHDRIRKDKQIDDSQKLTDQIDDVKIRSIVRAQIALQMAGVNYTPIDFTVFIKPARTPKKEP